MFQWAFGRALAAQTQVETYFDMSFFKKKYARPYELDIFNINCPKISDFGTKLILNLIWTLRKKIKNKSLFGFNFYSEAHFHYDENLFNLQPNTYIEGFFQSEKYFEKIKDIIRSDFCFAKEANQINKDVLAKIETTNSVSLHVRRGDYVSKKRYQNLYANCTLEYYRCAVEYIATKHDNPTLFIFSDDINWAKENLKLPFECVYVSHNTNADSYEDMRLMSSCKHNVIANSSFSWWGAWLNNNPQKIVIAPKKWFNDKNIIQTDIIPDSWIQIEN